MPTKSKPRVAIAYDFDGTLAPDNMQEHQFIPAIGMTKEAFWNEVKTVTAENEGDEILVYMSLMLEKADKEKVTVTREDLQKKGAGIKLFSGLDSWFQRVNHFANSVGVMAKHYMISSGIEELIRGNGIAKHFDKIYASKYRYDHYGRAEWPALAINYTNKTQFLFRINKGVLKSHDKDGVNKFVSPEERPIPFRNMIFIGDGQTDIPCFRLVKDLGGCSIAVYKPYSSQRKKIADSLKDVGRVHCALSADYSKDKDLEKIVFAKIREISARHELDTQL